MPTDSSSTEADVAATDTAEDRSAPVPRLGIIHIMLWTLCSAVDLAWMRAIYHLWELPPETNPLQGPSSVLRAAITGAVLAGAIVLVKQRLQSRGPMLRQPGHWLIFAYALLTVLYLPLATVMVLRTTGGATNSYVFLVGFLYAVQAAVYVRAYRTSDLRRWKINFGALAGSAALLAVSLFLPAIQILPLLWSLGRWLMFLVAILIVGVALGDHFSGRRRDWVHWTGIASYAATGALTLLWMVWDRVMQT